MAFCTVSNISKILIGLKNGSILLYCSQNNKEFERFEGHRQLVFDIKVAHDNSCFLSVSKDRTVKLWQFYGQRLSLDGLNNVVSSPKCVQNEHFDAFSPDRKNNFKQFVYNEDNDYLISANFSNNYTTSKIICTGTHNGKVILWNANTKEKLCASIETGFQVRDVYFSPNDSNIFFTKQEKIQIYKYENDKMHNCYDSIFNSQDNEEINRLFVPDENTLIAVGARHVTMYKLPYQNESSCINVYDSKDSDITCSAIAKGQHFAIGINKNVLLFDVSNGQHVETLTHKKIVTSIAMDILRDDDNFTSMILMNFDDDHLHQCNIMMQHYGQPRNKQELVTSYCKKNTPLLALVYNDSIVRIQHEFNVINEIKQSSITFMAFSLCGNNIIFALENGLIKEYQYKRQGHFREIAKLDGGIKYLQCFELSDMETSSEISYTSSDCKNGTIVAITEGDKKVHIIFEHGVIRNCSWEYSVFGVFPMGAFQLLCVDECEGVFIIDAMKDSNNIRLIRYGIYGRKVNAAAFCSKTNLLAVTFIEQNHQSNHLEIINVISKETVRVLSLSFVPTCCTFSYVGGLLVLGSEDGKIMLCNIQKNFKSTILSNTGLHINYVQFSRSVLPILVAAGREVSWWNLQNFETDVTNGNYSPHDGDFDLKFWENKTVHTEIPNLLQTVSLYSNAVHFSVSKNFEMFLIVDDESRTYVMKCFKNFN